MKVKHPSRPCKPGNRTRGSTLEIACTILSANFVLDIAVFLPRIGKRTIFVRRSVSCSAPEEDQKCLK
jgi:hypothetical protein